MGLFEPLDGSAKNASSWFIKTCICGDVLKGANEIFIQMLLCNKSRVRAQSGLLGVTRRPVPAAGSLPPAVPQEGPWGRWPSLPPARGTPATAGGSGTAPTAETPFSIQPRSKRCCWQHLSPVSSPRHGALARFGSLQVWKSRTLCPPQAKGARRWGVQGHGSVWAGSADGLHQGLKCSLIFEK